MSNRTARRWLTRGLLLCLAAVGLTACDPPDGRDLSVTVADAPATVVVGQEVNADVVLANVGTAPATGTTFNVVVPLGVTATVTSPGLTGCGAPHYVEDLHGTGFSCEAGAVAPGAQIDVDVALTGVAAGASGEVVVSAKSTGGGEPSGGGGAPHTATFPIAVGAPAIVDLHVTAPSLATPLQYGVVAASRTFVANRGTQPASPVTVTQQIPAGITVGSPTLELVGGGATGTCEVTGQTATCTTGANAVEPLTGTDDRWEMVVPITATSGSSYQIVHTATSPATEPDPDPWPNSATVTGWRDLAYLDIAAPDTVAAGSTFTAQVTWRGWGFGQYVSAYVPPNLRLDSIQGGAQYGLTCNGTGAIACSAIGPFMTDGVTLTFNFTALDPGGPGPFSLFINSEAGSASGYASIETVDPTISSDVHPSFTAPPFALVGQPVTITGEIRTAGPVAHHDVVAEIDLPAGAFATAATWGQERIPCPITGSTITCDIGSIDGHGQVPVELTLTSYVPGPTSVGITVTSSTPQGDPDPWPDSVTVSFPTRSPFVDLGLTAAHAPTSQNPPTEGQPHITTYTVTNHGSDVATGVTLAVEVPAGYTPYRATRISPVIPGGVGCTIVDQTVTCGIGPLAGGAYQRVEVFATTGAAGAASYSATVHANEADPVPDEQPNTATIPVEALAPNADLRITSSSTDSPILMGTERTLGAQIRNHGPSPVTGAVAHIVVPDGWQLVSASSASAPCSVSGNTATCGPRAFSATGTLPWDISVRVTPLEVRAGDELVFSVESELADLDLSNNTVTRTLTSLPYEVDLGVSTGITTFGQWHSYIVKVTNLGPAEATGVTLTGTYPEVVTLENIRVEVFGSANYPCTWTDHQFSCPMPDVPATGISWDVRIEMSIDPHPGPLTYQFAVTANETEADPEVLPNTIDVVVVNANQPLGIGGTVLGPGGAPVAGVQVRAYAQTDGIFPTAILTTAADGTWRAQHLQYGTYKLLFTPPAGSGLTAEWYQDQPNRTLATSLTTSVSTPYIAVVAHLG